MPRNPNESVRLRIPSLLSLGNHQKLKLEGYLAVEIPNLHKFEQGKCGTLVENQSAILEVVGSNPGTIYFP